MTQNAIETTKVVIDTNNGDELAFVESSSSRDATIKALIDANLSSIMQGAMSNSCHGGSHGSDKCHGGNHQGTRRN